MRAFLGLLLAVSAASARADGAGERFAADGCAACHRIGPRGGTAGPDLTLVGVRRPRAWLSDWLASPRGWKHDTRMPEQGLSASERLVLADYLSAQTGQAWEGTRPWDGLNGVEEGRLIYARAGCVGCHGPAGRGGHPNPGAHGDVIPALRPLMGTYTADELKRKIRAGVVPETHDVPAAVDMPPWKDVLTEGELDALSAYLLTLADAQSKSDW